MTTSTDSWFIQPYYSVNYNDGTLTIRSSSARKKGKEMRIRKNGDGYLVTNLAGKAQYIHALVTQHFLGTRPDGLEVNHKDGVKNNNRIENLEYISSGDNTRHAISMGLTRIRYGAEASSYIDGRYKDKAAYFKAYRLANRDKAKAYHQAYYLANIAQKKAYDKARRLAKKNIIPINKCNQQ